MAAGEGGEWKAISIEGFSHYEAHAAGAVRNSITGRVINGSRQANGYVSVNLRDTSGKSRTLAMHRLVAACFIANPLNKPQVDHIDRDKSNNNVNNLRWATSRENNHNKRSIGVQYRSRNTKSPYQARWTEIVGGAPKERVRGFSTEAEAREWAAQKRAEHAASTAEHDNGILKGASRMTRQQLIDRNLFLENEVKRLKRKYNET
jgi:HNH endonuclease